MALKQRFISVPDRSTLFFETVRISGPEAGFVVSADLRSGGSILKSWDHAEMTAAEQDHELRTPKVYNLLVDVTFTQSQTVDVEVRVRILKQNGEQHSHTKKLTFSGKRPKHQAGRVQIITKQA